MKLKANISKKIIFIAHGYYHGGASTSFTNLIQWADDINISYKIISTRNQPNNNLKININNKKKSFDIVENSAIIDSEAGITSPFKIIFLFILQKLKLNPNLVTYIRNFNPNYIVFNSTHHCWMVPLLKKLFPKIKTIVYVREQIKKNRSFAGKLNFNWLKSANKLICISKFEAKLLSNKKKYIIHNTIGKNYNFKKNLLFKDSINKLKILQMGQPSFSKGAHILIFALIKNRAIFAKAKFKVKSVLVGSGSKGLFKKNNVAYFIKTILFLNTRYLYRFILNLFKLNNTINLTEYITDVEPYLLNSDIYIRTSLSGDGWGRDLIEAMSSGLLCISSGESPFIENEETGFLYPPGDYIALAKTLLKISKMPKSKLKKIAKNGQKRIKELCSYKTFVNSLNINLLD